MSKAPVPSLSTVKVDAPGEQPAPPRSALKVEPKADERRESLYVRIPVSIVERLRKANYELRRPRQDIVAEALDAWLIRMGIT